ncbi:uncharacterized protein LOC122278582 [Carya illinoinensis]|uniref:uncharacterized protein LOC122278582 n=1 Tax=Carya illinoinensis TaxID=32201 RepID=UPI001C723223|nr:uncharacterized protein LOC122278582 [Carya illinoinensis]
MCLPVEEGGLGLHHLDDMQKALHMRFVWNLIQGNSLWAQFFKAKYVGSKPWFLIDANKGTRFWKMIANCIRLVLKNLKWSLREGNLFFWYDKWRNRGPLYSDLPVVGSHLLKVKECQLSNLWDVELLVNLVGQDHVNDILEFLTVCKGGSNVLVWMKKDSGCFSTKLAWDCIRIRGSTMNWHSWMWHSQLPLKVSVSMWKAWHHAIGVDDHLCRVGVPIVSKCDCCDAGKYEDQNHVLFERDLAARMWRYCGGIFGLPLHGNWKETVSHWFLHASSSSQVGIIVGLLHSLLSWPFWCRRCVAHMEDFTIFAYIAYRSAKALLEFRGLAQTPHGNFKLNTNGSGFRNPGSSGAGACKALMIGYVEVELDSQVVVSWWKQRRYGVWYLEDFWEVILCLLDSMDCLVCHVFKEGNKVADWLAKSGVLGHHMEQQVIGEVPRLLRSLICLDKLGVPSLRCSYV